MTENMGYLKNLKSESVVQRVINCLTDAMVSGELKPGERIPTEPELSEALGVARSSIREATKILTYLGVLENRRSEGTFVANGFQESMIDPMVYGIILRQDDSLQNLIELRELTEVGLLRLAILKSGEEELGQLDAQVANMERIAAQEGDILEELFQADNAFHDTVSILAHNPMADKINRVVRVLTYAMRHETVATMVHTGRTMELIDAHRLICKVLRSRDLKNLDEVINGTYFLEVTQFSAEPEQPERDGDLDSDAFAATQ